MTTTLKGGVPATSVTLMFALAPLQIVPPPEIAAVGPAPWSERIRSALEDPQEGVVMVHRRRIGPVPSVCYPRGLPTFRRGR